MRELSSPRTLLQQLIRQRRTSYERLVDQINDFAVINKIDATISVRHLQRRPEVSEATCLRSAGLSGSWSSSSATLSMLLFDQL